MRGQFYIANMGNHNSIHIDDPCEGMLKAYVLCAENHVNISPSVYEEYCEEEKNLYKDCRKLCLEKRKQKAGSDK
jgi:hypothetical protein